MNDPKLGVVKVRQWTDLHFDQAADHKVNLILVERLTPTQSAKTLPPLWLAWGGERHLSLELVWRKYLRRFGGDHWYRFAKQRLDWTLPNLSTPKQCKIETMMLSQR